MDPLGIVLGVAVGYGIAVVVANSRGQGNAVNPFVPATPVLMPSSLAGTPPSYLLPGVSLVTPVPPPLGRGPIVATAQGARAAFATSRGRR